MRRPGVLGDGRVVADVVPVAVGRDDELERPGTGRQLLGDPGQRGRGDIDGDGLARAGVGQDVDVGPDRPDDPMQTFHAGAPGGGSDPGVGVRSVPVLSSLVRMQSKVWPIILLAVPSMSRAPTLASVPAMFTSASQSMVVPPVALSDRRIWAVASTALPGAWPWALIVASFGALQLGELHVDVESGADEPDADLGRGLEVGVVDDLDGLDARAALADLVRGRSRTPRHDRAGHRCPRYRRTSWAALLYSSKRAAQERRHLASGHAGARAVLRAAAAAGDAGFAGRG